MKERIRERARELGFDDCRFAAATAPAGAAQFQKWLAAKHFGQMHWMERQAPKRLDPQKILPGAKSVICVAASYHLARNQRSEAAGNHAPAAEGFPAPPATETGATGVIARYARLDDYHDVLGEKLKRLAQFVDETGGPSARSLWYVDTGPILERDYAQRAGLGFIGKHTNLISRQFGNWIFLAEILTTLELEPDPPEQNHCGRCTRCLTACPTGAITAPFELDARKCISYLTIELKGPIPVEFRRAIGNRVFGCDDCLAACPWNRFAREGRLMKSHVREDLQQPALTEWLALDEKSFQQKFAGSPILRAKRRGFLRNVCVVLGNIGNESALPALEKAARDPEPLIAEHARWAMDEIRARAKPKRNPPA